MRGHGRKRLAAIIPAIVALSIAGCVDERIVYRDRDVVGELPPNHGKIFLLMIGCT